MSHGPRERDNCPTCGNLKKKTANLCQQCFFQAQRILRSPLNETELGTEKTCPRCQESYPLDAEFFYRHAGAPNGFHSYCKACFREYTATRHNQPAKADRHSKGGLPYNRGGAVCIASGVSPYSDVVPDSLAEDVHVRYTYDQDARPNIACPHCEATSKTVGEPETLSRLSGKVGLVTEIQDPHDNQDPTCRVCDKAFPRPDWFDENGIAVKFRTIEPYS